MAFKIVVSDPKTRRAYQKDIEEAASSLIGKKIGDKVLGDPLGLAGYELEVTGGSDKDGFPMRGDIEGIGRKRVLVSTGIGFHAKYVGQRRRRSIRGNTISAQIVQINLKAAKHGSKTIEESWAVAAKEAKKKSKTKEKKEAFYAKKSGKVEATVGKTEQAEE